MEVDGFGIPTFLFEMANIRKSTTGLPMNIWASPKPENSKKGLRIKVSKTYGNRFDADECFSLLNSNQVEVEGDTGEIKNADIEAVKSYLLNHRQAFLLFWEKKIDDDDLKRLLKAGS